MPELPEEIDVDGGGPITPTGGDPGGGLGDPWGPDTIDVVPIPHSESVGLFISSDGPPGGPYGSSTSNDLLLYGGGDGGIEHFTNWDARISSLDNNGIERFESRFASNYLGYEFAAEKVKVVDDVAAVAYPNYTHINKTVWEHVDGSVYKPFQINGVDYDDSIFYSNSEPGPITIGGTHGFMLPLLNIRGLHTPTLDATSNSQMAGFYDNLFFVMELDGYYTDADGDMVYDATLDGQRHIFTYTSNYNSRAQYTYFYDPRYSTFTLFFPDSFNVDSLLDASLIGPSDYILNATNDNARYHTTQAEADIVLLDYDPSGTGSANETGQAVIDATVAGGTLGWGVLGYSKISMIKYSPSVECGRVDLYQRKKGPVTSITSQAVVTSASHELQSSDMIKIVGSLDSVDADDAMNGIKYIQVNDVDRFTLYDDSSFLNRTNVDSTTLRNPISWVLLGSSVNAQRQGWAYRKTLMSPDGKNGVNEVVSNQTEFAIVDRDGIPILDRSNDFILSGARDATPTPASFDQDVPIGLKFNGALQYINILPLDVPGPGYDFFNGDVPISPNSSRYNALWSGPQHFIGGYHFGSDIDLIKSGSDYKLLVGEAGPDSFVRYDAGVWYNLPDVPPNGKMHLINIVSEANKTFTCTLDQTLNASTGDSDIPDAPAMTSGSSMTANFYAGSDNTTSTSLTYGSVEQEKLFKNIFLQTRSYLGNSYWRGAMMYHLPDIFINDLNTVSDNNVFDDAWLAELIQNVPDEARHYCPYRAGSYYGLNPTPYGQVNPYAFYAFVDNFGKAVSLDIVGSTLFGGATSTVKNLNDGENGSPSCGFVHVFNMGTSTKIHVLDGEIMSTPSDSFWKQQYYASRLFGKCLIMREGRLFYGMPKPEEYSSAPTNISQIFYYECDGTEYIQGPTIINPNSREVFSTESIVSRGVFTVNAWNYKESYLRGEDQTLISGDKFYPTDRFGAYFSYQNGILAANALDIFNDIGLRHTDKGNDLVGLCDYINIYEWYNDKWAHISKNSATIDSSLSKYSYQSTLYPRVNGSLRAIGNMSYSQKRASSVTWDIDLTGCFVVADTRVIIKDPLGYAILDHDWQQTTQAKVAGIITYTVNEVPDYDIPVFPYFNYQENFLAYEENDVVYHSKFNSIYSYTSTNVIETNSDSFEQSVNHKTPIYFLNVPNDSVGAINNITIDLALENNDLDQALYQYRDDDVKLVIYRRDPRLTLIPNSDYVELINGYGELPDLPGGLAIANRPANNEWVYQHGAHNSYLYSDITPLEEAPWAKLILGTLVVNVDTLIFRFRIGLADLNNYVRSGSALQDSIRYINRGEDRASHRIDMLDIDKNTYDSSMDVEDTLIIGFIRSSDYSYKIPSSGISSYSASITSMDAYIDSTLVEGDSDSVYVTGASLYQCISDSIIDHSFSSVQNADGNKRLVYTNPVLTLGTSSSASSTDATGNVVYDGTFSQSYQLISVDREYYQADAGSPTGPVLVPVINTSSQFSRFNNTKSFDIQKLEYLPLFLHSNLTENNSLDLTLASVNEDTNSVDLFTYSNGFDTSMDLYLDQTGSDSNSMDLSILNAAMYDQDLNLTMGNFEHYNSLDVYLHTVVEYSGGVNLYTVGPLAYDASMPLSVITDDYSPVSSNTELYMYGNTSSSYDKFESQELNITGGLYSSLISDTYLNISGNGSPSDIQASGDMSLYIGYRTEAYNNNLSIYLYNDQLGSTNAINLFTKSTYAHDDNMPLHISRRGQDGQEESGNSADLFIANSEVLDDISLYTHAAFAGAESLDLFCSGVGEKHGDAKIFIRGYRQ